MRLLGIVSRSGETASPQMRDRLPAVVNTPELRFPCSRGAQIRGRSTRCATAEAAPAPRCPISTACACKTRDGWWLLRASNTQDVLVARAEAKDEAGLARLKALLADQLRASGMTPPPDF